MNRKALGRLASLIVLLIAFIIVNTIGVWAHGQEMPTVKEWIGIVLFAILEYLVVLVVTRN